MGSDLQPRDVLLSKNIQFTAADNNLVKLGTIEINRKDLNIAESRGGNSNLIFVFILIGLAFYARMKAK
jgi:hypothetical protein